MEIFPLHRGTHVTAPQMTPMRDFDRKFQDPFNRFMGGRGETGGCCSWGSLC